MAVSAPKVSTPKVSAPKTSSPKVSAPKTGSPKVATPKSSPGTTAPKTADKATPERVNLSKESQTPQSAAVKKSTDEHIKAIHDAFELEGPDAAAEAPKPDAKEEPKAAPESGAPKKGASPATEDKGGFDPVGTVTNGIKTGKDIAKDTSKFVGKHGAKIGRFTRRVGVGIDDKTINKTAQTVKKTGRALGKVGHPASLISNGNKIVNGNDAGERIQGTVGAAGDAGQIAKSFKLGGKVVQKLATKAAAPLSIAADTVEGGRQVYKGFNEGNTADMASGGLKLASAAGVGTALALGLSGPVGWAVGGAALAAWGGSQVIDNWDTIKSVAGGWFN